MNIFIKNWLKKNTYSLKGKKIVITGATGGLGKELCFYLAYLNAELILINRNEGKATSLKNEIITKYNGAKVTLLYADFENINDVDKVCSELKIYDIDIIIHNAAVYAIERRIVGSGYLNVFQTNFVSPLYITNKLLPQLENTGGKIVVVGSIAHNYLKTNINDIDCRTYKSDALSYGNSKRYLMFYHEQLLKNSAVSFSLAHPGITFTSITNHYPDWLFRIIKYPMKVIFMKKNVAALNILKGVFENTKEGEWLSPLLFGIWGTPVVRKLKTATLAEKEQIYSSSLEILNNVLVKDSNTEV